MQRKQVPVEELQFGMYVAELDRPWTETPFMFQGFHLRTDQQLSALKKHCKHVFIDIGAHREARDAPAPAGGRVQDPRHDQVPGERHGRDRVQGRAPGLRAKR